MSADPLLIEGLNVARGGRPVLHDVTLSIPCRRGHGAPRPERRRQVDARPRGGRRSASARRAASMLDGDDLTKRRPEKVRASGLAVVPEGRRLLPVLTVEDNLRVATYALGRAEAKAGIARALELFPELEKRWTIQARSLSGGEQQMVVLAQALVSSPKFILVDELSLGLAPVVVKRLVPALEQVAQTGVGVLLIEQFAHVALGAREQGIRARRRSGSIRRHVAEAQGRARAAALRLSPPRLAPRAARAEREVADRVDRGARLVEQQVRHVRQDRRLGAGNVLRPGRRLP